MPRPDYERFVHSFNGHYKELTVDAPELNDKFFESYANVYDNRTVLFEDTNPHNGIEIGVKIDVFPLDGVPSDPDEYKQFRSRMTELNNLRGAHKYTLAELLKRIILTRKGISSLILRCKHPFSTYSGIQREMHKMATQYDWNGSEYVDQVTFQKTKNTRLPRQIYEQLIEVPFEDQQFKVPADYDSVLRIIFGDYMQLPPESERVYSHGFSAYWKD
jgi:lipopolysaccharide cholinephosphotransferase